MSSQYLFPTTFDDLFNDDENEQGQAGGEEVEPPTERLVLDLSMKRDLDECDKTALRLYAKGITFEQLKGFYEVQSVLEDLGFSAKVDNKLKKKWNETHKKATEVGSEIVDAYLYEGDLRRAGFSEMLSRLPNGQHTTVLVLLGKNGIKISEHPTKNQLYEFFKHQRAEISSIALDNHKRRIQAYLDAYDAIEVPLLHDEMILTNDEPYDFGESFVKAEIVAKKIKNKIIWNDAEPLSYTHIGEVGKVRSNITSCVQRLAELFPGVCFYESGDETSEVLINNTVPIVNEEEIEPPVYCYFAPKGSVGDVFTNSNAYSKVGIDNPQGFVNLKGYSADDYQDLKHGVQGVDVEKFSSNKAFTYTVGDQRKTFIPARISKYTQISDVKIRDKNEILIMSLNMVEGAKKKNGWFFSEYVILWVCSASQLCICIPQKVAGMSKLLADHVNSQSIAICARTFRVTSSNVANLAKVGSTLMITMLPVLTAMYKNPENTGRIIEKYAGGIHQFMKSKFKNQVLMVSLALLLSNLRQYHIVRMKIVKVDDAEFDKFCSEYNFVKDDGLRINTIASDCSDFVDEIGGYESEADAFIRRKAQALANRKARADEKARLEAKDLGSSGIVNVTDELGVGKEKEANEKDESDESGGGLGFSFFDSSGHGDVGSEDDEKVRKVVDSDEI